MICKDNKKNDATGKKTYLINLYELLKPLFPDCSSQYKTSFSNT